MNRHPLDGNAIAADKHYGRDAPEMRECPQCFGDGYFHDATGRDFDCGFCGKTGFVPVEHEEPEAQERDE